MIYFDWKKILEASHGNVGDIITILRIVTYKRTPKNYYDKTFRFYEKSHFYLFKSTFYLFLS